MTDNENPYQAPAADLDPPVDANTEAFTPAMVQALTGTKPWVRFLSILGFVFCGLFVLGGLFFAILVVFIPELGGSSDLIPAIVSVVVFMAIGGIGVVPALQLHKYANAIANVQRDATTPGIEHALGRQHSFWRTAAIMTLIVVGLYFGAIFITVIASVFGAMASSF